MDNKKLRSILGDESRKKRSGKASKSNCSFYDLVTGVTYEVRVLPKDNKKNPDGFKYAAWHKNPDYDVDDQKGNMLVCLLAKGEDYCPMCHVLDNIEIDDIVKRIEIMESYRIPVKIMSATVNGQTATLSEKDEVGSFTFPDAPGFVRILSLSEAAMTKFLRNVITPMPTFDDPFKGRNVLITKLAKNWDIGLSPYDSALDIDEYSLLMNNMIDLNLLFKKAKKWQELEEMCKHIPGMERYNDEIFEA